jgi:signal transduction histidine kinase
MGLNAKSSVIEQPLAEAVTAEHPAAGSRTTPLEVPRAVLIPAPPPSTAALLDRALQSERLRNARRINLIRFIGVTFFFLLFVTLALVLQRRTWQGNLHFFAPYWVVTAVLYLVGRRNDSAARFMSLAIALVDMPMVFLIQWATFPTTPVPSAVAGYTLGIYVLLLVIESLSLDQRKIYFTAAVACFWEGLLQRLAGVETGAIVSTVIVMGITATVCAYGSRRLSELAVKVAQDVAQRRRAEEELRLRDEFLSVASHELKTPLTALQLEVEGLVRRVRLAGSGAIPAEFIRNRLDSADAQTERLARLINQLLDVTRLTAGRLQLDLEEVDLASVAGNVASQLGDALERNGSSLAMDLGGRPHPVLGGHPHPVLGRWDRLRLEQVVTNLLGNAIKYGEGRPISVSVAHHGPDAARLIVRDHGIGIAPADQQRIFERFERTAPEREFGGLGLGLWICGQITRALGGTIAVSSQLGAGATFTVTLPLSGPPTTASGE